MLRELAQEHKAYEAILTDPDILADYTCEFFGPNGPYPVEQEDPNGFYDAEGYYYDSYGYYDLDGTYYYDDYYNALNPEVYNAGYDYGYDYGYDNSYGYDTSYNSGYDVNYYNQGYDNSYDTGYDSGYDAGYDNSYAERPSLPVPPHPENTVDGQSFWNNFGSVAERDPSNAWRYLSMAQRNPNVFREKLLVMD